MHMRDACVGAHGGEGGVTRAHVSHMCVGAHGGRKRAEIPWSWSHEPLCIPSRGRWEPNWGPLGEQQGPSPAGVSLQPHQAYFQKCY